MWYLSSAPSPLRARTRQQRSAAERKPGSSTAGANGPYGLFSAADLSGAFGFADGRLVIDFIAQEFGLPLLPPSKAKNASFAQGANFAITGATALDTEFFEKRGLGKSVRNSGSLFTQIQWLRDLKPSFCNSTQECKDFFAKSLFVVGELGGNDYNAPLFAGKDLGEAYNLMPHVVQGISDGVEQLIAEGAKDLILPGMMPSGCLARSFSSAPFSIALCTLEMYPQWIHSESPVASVPEPQCTASRGLHDNRVAVVNLCSGESHVCDQSKHQREPSFWRHERLGL